MLSRIRRVLRKPPGYIVQRLRHEALAQAERFLGPARARRLTADRLARRFGHGDADSWWDALSRRPFLTALAFDRAEVDAICPGESDRILALAEDALAHRVDLLGSGPIELGAEIDWHRDYKSGIRWQPAFCRDIKYNDLDRPSDVKFPWEVSRMQWVLPLGQAYLLTADERYASEARRLIEHWIASNPFARSVNWACTMDVALRMISWCWLFHALARSDAWSDAAFRRSFLASLYQHADFTSRHLEKSDVNGNHYTADAAGLVFAGLFFGPEGDASAWHDLGWSILSSEIELQVFADGVDFEASVPYHRLVQELFLYPAIYRLNCGFPVAEPYLQRLVSMAEFTAAYSRPDGTVPLWGDADDARTLPFRTHPINEHRYLLALAGMGLGADHLTQAFSGPRSEALWMFGSARAGALPERDDMPPSGSAAFRDGGFFVLRNDRDHVFVDCGPLGLAGRGGHGHNDLLSFEAMLDGVRLVSDCGAYLYTADYRERNSFRSTSYHNTPQVDAEEVNRFVRPDYLWFLHDDARFGVERLDFGAERDELQCFHTGYERLPFPVTVRRRFTLDHLRHSLTVEDHFEGQGEHAFEVPLHLVPGVDCVIRKGSATLTAAGRSFLLSWTGADDWTVIVAPARVSPSYGVCVPSQRIAFTRTGAPEPLAVTIAPTAS